MVESIYFHSKRDAPRRSASFHLGQASPSRTAPKQFSDSTKKGRLVGFRMNAEILFQKLFPSKTPVRETRVR